MGICKALRYLALYTMFRKRKFAVFAHYLMPPTPLQQILSKRKSES